MQRNKKFDKTLNERNINLKILVLASLFMRTVLYAKIHKPTPKCNRFICTSCIVYKQPILLIAITRIKGYREMPRFSKLK